MKNKSIKLIWTFFYVLTLLLPLSATLILFIRVNSILKTEIENKNYSLLQKMGENIELQISAAEIAFNEIYLNKKVQQISRKDLPLTAADKYLTYEFIRDLNTQEASKNNNFTFLLYFRNLDWVIALNASRESRSYFDAYFSDTGISYEEWKNDFLLNENPLISLNNELSENRVTLYYTHQITVSKATNNIVNILIGLDSNKIINEYNNLYSPDEGVLFITDATGNLLTSIGNLNLKHSEINQEALVSSTKVGTQTIHGEKYTLLTYFSKDSKLQFTYVLPNKTYLSELTPVYRLTTVCYTFSMLIGIVLIYSFMKLTYRPINDLVNIFGQKLNIRSNEFELIKHGIQESHAEKLYYHNISRQQKDIIRHYTILHMLHGLLTGNDTLEQLFSDLDTTQISDNFVVLACYYNHFSTATNDENSSDILHAAFKSLAIDALTCSGNVTLDTTIDNVIVIIVNIPPSVSDTDGIQEDMQKAYSEAEALYQITPLILISNIHNNIYGIAEAYDEIQRSMNSLNTDKLTGIICYHQLHNHTRCTEYYYPLEKEQLLINYIKSGSQNQALSLLDNVFRENFKNTVVPIELATCLSYNIAGTIIKAIEQSSPSSKTGRFKAINPAYLISKCKTFEDMKRTLQELICLCCTHTSSIDTEGPEKLVEDVKSYIQTNYTDVNLNVSIIADYFCVQQSYLSKIFKKVTHIGLLEYINSYRLNQSARLLRETSKSINDICTESGYSNYRTFSRLFLKYYGVSAQAYRNNNEKNEDI